MVFVPTCLERKAHRESALLSVLKRSSSIFFIFVYLVFLAVMFFIFVREVGEGNHRVNIPYGLYGLGLGGITAFFLIREQVRRFQGPDPVDANHGIHIDTEAGVIYASDGVTSVVPLDDVEALYTNALLNDKCLWVNVEPSEHRASRQRHFRDYLDKHGFDWPKVPDFAVFLACKRGTVAVCQTDRLEAMLVAGQRLRGLLGRPFYCSNGYNADALVARSAEAGREASSGLAAESPQGKEDWISWRLAQGRKGAALTSRATAEGYRLTLTDTAGVLWMMLVLAMCVLIGYCAHDSLVLLGCRTVYVVAFTIALCAASVALWWPSARLHVDISRRQVRISEGRFYAPVEFPVDAIHDIYNATFALGAVVIELGRFDSQTITTRQDAEAFGYALADCVQRLRVAAGEP